MHGLLVHCPDIFVIRSALFGMFAVMAAQNADVDPVKFWTQSSDPLLIFCSESSGVLSHRGKKKTIPLQAWRGREVSRRLRLPDFKTFGI